MQYISFIYFLFQKIMEIGHLLVSYGSEVIETTFFDANSVEILQIVEFISILLSVGSEAAENELIHLGAIRRILELFFE